MNHTLLSSAQSTLSRSGLGPSGKLDGPSLFILKHGWAPATTRQYAAAVNKFLLFLSTTGQLGTVQLFKPKLVYLFILWCSAVASKKVLTSTIKRYLSGLRMWHSLHGNTFPAVDSHRIRLLLKSCARTEVTSARRTRSGLTLQDAVNLTDQLSTSSKLDLVMKSIILVGFWGLARLGELTWSRDHPTVFIRRRDVVFYDEGKRARIAIRMAKTSNPGELQFLHLASQPNRLDPINVLHELLRRVTGVPDDPLFPGSTPGKPMHRSLVSAFLRANGPSDTHQWSGHSLRIGGASFQHHAGRNITSLKRLGRWKSSAYKVYINKYSSALRANTVVLAKRLNF